jgi:acylphosphatase
MVDVARIVLRVEGRVQGVGYRYFALEKANALGLKGWVSNLADGAVAAEAEGPKAALDAWLAQLHRGPSMARVDRLQVDTVTGTQGPFTHFEIR